MKRKRNLALLVVLCMTMSAFADTLYNIDFNRLVTSYSGPAATGSAGDSWNMISTSFVNVTDKSWELVDSSGAASTVALNTTGATGTGYSSSLTNQILEDYWQVGNTAQSLSLTGLKNNATYSIYVYADWSYNNTSILSATIGGNNQSLTTIKNNSFVLNGNYLVFSDLTPSNGIITMTFSGSGPAINSAPICGFQIIETVPEPATMAIIGLGSMLVVVRKNRR